MSIHQHARMHTLLEAPLSNLRHLTMTCTCLAMIQDAAPAGDAASKKSEQLRYLVLPGNESVLMREAMERRSWWKPAKEAGPWNMWFGGNGQKFDFSKFSGSEYGSFRRLRPQLHVRTSAQMEL